MNAVAAQPSWKPVLVAAGLALLVGLVGGLATDIGSWYESLAKPRWQPPDWLFGPVWTLIYALMVAAGSLAWFASETRAARQNLLIVFLLNAVLNVGWSLLFFRFQRPDLALIEVAFLWSSIVLLIYVCAKRRKLAGALLLPYLFWVTFAAILNSEIVRLNSF
jgi:tryptophan-rich sensory protein